MDSLIDLFTSKTGVIAAVTVLLGMVAAALGILRPILQRRREAGEARARLAFSEFEVTAPPSCSTAGRLRFQVMNSGHGKSILRSLRLVVIDAHPSETLRMVEAGAPVPEHRHQVRLDPKTREYDVRGRAFGDGPAAISYEAEEVETFIVELSSSEPWWYRFKIVGGWYDSKHPEEAKAIESAELDIEFPPDPAQLLAREGG